MLKLKRYLKPYLGLLLVGVALLFGQAMLELTLPNYMSDIVNVGLQQGGITQAAPEVIDSDAMAMMQMFMSKEDKALVNAAYEPLSEREDAADLKKTYPNTGDEDLALAADPENGVNEAFNRAAYALVSMMEELAPADSATQSEEQASGTLDAEAMVQLTAMMQSGALDEQLNEAIATAAVTPESMLDQTGVVLTKSFYTQLGADTDAIQTSYILKVGLRMAGLAILLTVCAISAGFCMARLGAGVGRDLRRGVFRKVSYFNNNEMDQFSGASLITRSTNDITQVQNFLSIGLRMMCFAPIMGIGGLIMGLSKCLNLAWVLALALIVMLGLILTLFAVAMPRFKKMQTLIDRLNLVSREELSGLMVVRAFSNQPFMQNRFEKANKDLNGNTLFVNRAMVTMMPFMMLVMNGLSLLIVWFGGKQIAASNLQVGDMMAFIQYAMQVIMSFLFISMMFIMVPRASVSAERINEVLTCESTVADPAQPTEMNHPVKGVVEFKDVSFRYEGADANVLEHVSFTARPGETVAFIGATGPLKTTRTSSLSDARKASSKYLWLKPISTRSPSKEAST